MLFFEEKTFKEKKNLLQGAFVGWWAMLADGRWAGWLADGYGRSLVRFQLRTKPATKACKKDIFGKVVMVKVLPA